MTMKKTRLKKAAILVLSDGENILSAEPIDGAEGVKKINGFKINGFPEGVVIAELFRRTPFLGREWATKKGSAKPSPAPSPKPDVSEVRLPVESTAPAPKKRRGRPPGSKNAANK